MGLAKKSNQVVKSILKVEYFAGDSMKVIGEMCHQLSEFDMLQNQEILDVIIRDLNLNKLPDYSKSKKRPRAPKKYVENYHSGNDLTLSRIRRESNCGNRFSVIRTMCEHLSFYDNLNKTQIIALIKSYLINHIIEIDLK